MHKTLNKSQMTLPFELITKIVFCCSKNSKIAKIFAFKEKPKLKEGKKINVSKLPNETVEILHYRWICFTNNLLCFPIVNCTLKILKLVN